MRGIQRICDVDMTRKVYKYLIPPPHEPLSLPKGALFRYFGLQGGELYVWYEVDADVLEIEAIALGIFGTGQEIPLLPEPAGFAWRASCVDGPFVWHLYQLLA